MSQSIAAWSDYWSDSAGAGCLSGAPPALLAELASTWRSLALTLAPGASVLDVAAGDGAVIRAMRAVRPDLKLMGIDSAVVGPAAAAIGVRGGVHADALPFEDGRFDAVLSQFGIEYCPAAAIAEAVRVAAPGATILLICHHADSVAVQHNARRAAAMVAMVEAGLLSLARRVALGGTDDAATTAKINRACEAYRDQSIVGELPLALGRALAGRQAVAMVQAISVRALAEIGRLQAMRAAALNEAAAATVVAEFDRLGVHCTARAVLIERGSPMAWEIKGKRC